MENIKLYGFYSIFQKYRKMPGILWFPFSFRKESARDSLSPGWCQAVCQLARQISVSLRKQKVTNENSGENFKRKNNQKML